MVCGGANTRIVSVSEDGMCLYHIVMETPFACLRWGRAAVGKDVYDLQRRLAALPQ